MLTGDLGMTAINRLTQIPEADDDDIIVIWDAENRVTRSILAVNLKSYITDDTVVDAKYESGDLILIYADGTEKNIGNVPATVTILDDGVEIGTADVFNYKSGMNVSVSSGIVEVSASAETEILDDDVSQGTATQLDFGANISATVSAGKATIDVPDIEVEILNDDVSQGNSDQLDFSTGITASVSAGKTTITADQQTIEIEDNGVNEGSVDTIDFDSGLSVSVAANVATVTADQQTVEIQDSTVSQGQSAVLNFGENLAAFVSAGITTIDSNDLSKVEWVYPWAQAEYPAYTMTRGAEFTMISNKITDEYPFPQTVGDPSYLMDSQAFINSSNTSVIYSGHTYTFTHAGYLSQIRVWAPQLTSDTHYRIVIADITDPANPIIESIPEPILNENNWTIIAANQVIVGAGTVLRIYLDALNSGSDTILPTYDWTYEGVQNSNQPSSMQWNRNNQHSVLRINYIDELSIDRSSDLAQVTVGSKIRMSESLDLTEYWEYDVTSVTNTGSTYEYGVLLTDTGGSGVPVSASTQWLASIPVAQPTQFANEANFWVSNEPDFATIEGFLEFSGIPQAGQADTGFGVDIRFQELEVSPDWDVIAISSSASGGGGGLDSASVARYDRSSYTGIHTVSNLSVNGGDNHQFDIAPISGQFVDFSDPSSPNVFTKSFAGATGVVGIFLGSAAVKQTYITMDKDFNIIQRTSLPDQEEGEQEWFLGNMTHGNDLGTNDIFADATDTPFNDYSMSRTFREFLRIFGGINISGLEYSGVSATLSMMHSSGAGLVLGRNQGVDLAFPDPPTALAENPVPVIVQKYEDSSGDLLTAGPVTAFLDPDQYRTGGGVLANVPNNNWTIKRIFFFYQSNTTIMYYGNDVYPNLDSARSGIFTEIFNEHPTTKESCFRGYLLVQKGATDTTDPTEAEFRISGGFRPFGSGSGLSNVTSLQGAYDNGSSITTSLGQGSLTITQGSGADADIQFNIENGALSTTFAIDALGNVIGSEFIGGGSQLTGIPYTVVEDVGLPQTLRLNTNFVGANISDDAGNNATDIRITQGEFEHEIVAAQRTILSTDKVGREYLISSAALHTPDILILPDPAAVDPNWHIFVQNGSFTGNLHIIQDHLGATFYEIESTSRIRIFNNGGAFGVESLYLPIINLILDPTTYGDLNHADWANLQDGNYIMFALGSEIFNQPPEIVLTPANNYFVRIEIRNTTIYSNVPPSNDFYSQDCKISTDTTWVNNSRPFDRSGTSFSAAVVNGWKVTMFTSDSGGSSGYTTIEDNGVGLTPRSVLNFLNADSIVDNAGNGSTDVTLPSGGGASIISFASQSRTSTQTMPINIDTTLIANTTVSTQRGTAYNSTTGITTVPVGQAGIWKFAWNANFLVNGTNVPPILTLRVKVNASMVAEYIRPYTNVGNFGGSIYARLDLAEGDEVTITCLNGTGQTVSLQGTGLLYNVQFVGA